MLKNKTLLTSILSVVFIGVVFLWVFNHPKSINVILIAFDGLQAKHLSAYGYPLNTTPNLDQLLGQSYIFTRTVSPAPWTVPSFMSIFTSMYPSEHRVVNKFAEYDKINNRIIQANLKQLTPNAVTLAEIFQQNGYLTAGFTGDAGVSAVFGNGQGFDVFYDEKTFGGFDASMPLALTWLKQNKDKKFFLFVHGYDVHGQYAPPGGFDYRFADESYQGQYTGSVEEQRDLREAGLAGNLNLSSQDVNFWRAIYDEKIARADEKFGDFMRELNKLDLDKNTLIVVFSDHGTEFYEHKTFDHGHTLYSELLNTLFAIHLPGQKQGQKIDSLVSTLDIFPTVLKLASIGNPVSQQVRGIDISPSFFGKDVSRDVFSETDYRLYTYKRSIEIKDGWKFILTLNGPSGFQKELYNLNSDPLEQINLLDQEPQKAYEFEQAIYNHLKEMKVDPLGPWLLGCSPVYGDQCQ